MEVANAVLLEDLRANISEKIIVQLHKNVYSAKFYKALSIIIMPFSVVKWVSGGAGKND